MTDAKPLTAEEEREWREPEQEEDDAPSCDCEHPGWLAPWAVARAWATLDAVRAEKDALAREVRAWRAAERDRVCGRESEWTESLAMACRLRAINEALGLPGQPERLNPAKSTEAVDEETP